MSILEHAIIAQRLARRGAAAPDRFAFSEHLDSLLRRPGRFFVLGQAPTTSRFTELIHLPRSPPNVLEPCAIADVQTIERVSPSMANT